MKQQEQFDFGDNVSELIRGRVGSIAKQDTSFKIGKEEGRGDSAIVYNCTTSEEIIPAVLKVSKMDEGIPEKERTAYTKLEGVKGIPRVLQTYWDKETITALLLEKIFGVSLNEYLTTHENIGKVLIGVYELMDEFHARGLRMPSDWLKDDNWKITDDGIPYLIDLGESRTLNAQLEESRTEITADIRGFYRLIEANNSRLNKNERKILEKILDRAYRNNEYYRYGGNPDDR